LDPPVPKTDDDADGTKGKNKGKAPMRGELGEGWNVPGQATGLKGGWDASEAGGGRKHIWDNLKKPVRRGFGTDLINQDEPAGDYDLVVGGGNEETVAIAPQWEQYDAAAWEESDAATWEEYDATAWEGADDADDADVADPADEAGPSSRAGPSNYRFSAEGAEPGSGW
jgi:hypothetical protein